MLTTSKSARPSVPTPAAARYNDSGCAQPAGADTQHLGGFEPLLTRHCHLGHDEVPGIALDFRRGQGHRRRTVAEQVGCDHKLDLSQVLVERNSFRFFIGFFFPNSGTDYHDMAIMCLPPRIWSSLDGNRTTGREPGSDPRETDPVRTRLHPSFEDFQIDLDASLNIDQA